MHYGLKTIAQARAANALAQQANALATERSIVEWVVGRWENTNPGHFYAYNSGQDTAHEVTFLAWDGEDRVEVTAETLAPPDRRQAPIIGSFRWLRGVPSTAARAERTSTGAWAAATSPPHAGPRPWIIRRLGAREPPPAGRDDRRRDRPPRAPAGLGAHRLALGVGPLVDTRASNRVEVLQFAAHILPTMCRILEVSRGTCR